MMSLDDWSYWARAVFSNNTSKRQQNKAIQANIQHSIWFNEMMQSVLGNNHSSSGGSSGSSSSSGGSKWS